MGWRFGVLEAGASPVEQRGLACPSHDGPADPSAFSLRASDGSVSPVNWTTAPRPPIDLPPSVGTYWSGRPSRSRKAEAGQSRRSRSHGVRDWLAAEARREEGVADPNRLADADEE